MHRLRTAYIYTLLTYTHHINIGMLYLWNIDQGLNQVDKFFHHPDDYIKAGACLAVGILSSGVRNESDPALALLSEYLDSTSIHIRLAAICGLGIAFIYIVIMT